MKTLLAGSTRAFRSFSRENIKMTKRLYYEDSYLKEFSGAVLECRQTENGPAVVLDQTVFYPESGGQPYDTGVLNNARVLKVLENDTGTILHILDREIHVGPVTGRIDWARRFDHMQQHTGQHILSQAFLAVAGAQTLSFHMGAEISTIDIELSQPLPEKMEEAQALATEIVFQNRPVHILVTDQAGLSSLGVRKESRREGEIRVIEVDGFDRSACGGTHVRNTGEIGIVFVSSFERYKGGARVDFAAGARAMQLLQKDHELIKRLARVYSSAPEKMVEVSEKLLQERAALNRENQLLQVKILEAEAAELIRGALKTGNCCLIDKTFTGRNLENVKILAQKLTEHPGVVAVLGLSDACQIVVARSKDLQGNCGDLIKKTVSELGGKGGGRPELAQAGGFSGDCLDLWMKALAQYFCS